jgi:hypothetical protein
VRRDAPGGGGRLDSSEVADGPRGSWEIGGDRGEQRPAGSSRYAGFGFGGKRPVQHAVDVINGDLKRDVVVAPQLDRVRPLLLLRARLADYVTGVGFARIDEHEPDPVAELGVHAAQYRASGRGSPRSARRYGSDSSSGARRPGP